MPAPASCRGRCTTLRPLKRAGPHDAITAEAIHRHMPAPFTSMGDAHARERVPTAHAREWCSRNTRPREPKLAGARSVVAGAKPAEMREREARA